MRHRIFFGYRFYAYYGFFCRPSVRNGHIAMPLRAWLSLLQRPDTNGPSPGKITHFPCPPTSLTLRNYGKDIGLRQSMVPRPSTKPPRGSHQAWVTILAPASFRSLIGFPSPVYSLLGQIRKVSSGTLAFAYTFPPFRVVAGLSPASSLSCRSHTHCSATLHSGFLHRAARINRGGESNSWAVSSRCD